MSATAAAHEARLRDLRAALAAQAAAGPEAGPQVGLVKQTSNLFRDRAPAARPKVSLAGFDQVVSVDSRAGLLEAEGMTPYDRLVDATLAHAVMPCVVPQLKGITLGGAVTGVGIEASSCRWGLVHETVAALEILLADGDVVTATADNEHADLFFGFPNSYGTLGYALKVTARTLPVKRFVRLDHRPHTDARAYFDDLARCCAGDADFVDGTVFSPQQMYVTEGRFVDEAPYTSDYTFEKIFYRSIAERREDYLSVHDYLWRWDTDWFWCSANFGLQNPTLRRLAGRSRLNSRTYTRLMRLNSRFGLLKAVDRVRGLHYETVIQDVDIPIGNAAGFLDFLVREIGLLPIWTCPTKVLDPARRYPLFPMRADTLYVNFGFWGGVRSREALPPGERNRRLERAVEAAGGVKSLYSDSYYDRETFDRLYGGDAYRALKRKYDPRGRFKDLYAKCVLRH